jgi:cysteine desulfurase
LAYPIGNYGAMWYHYSMAWMRKRTYLDWAAAAPVTDRAHGVFLAALAAYGNPASPHEEGRKAKALLEDARTRIARMAEVKTEGVVFTAGATEANALAILGAVHANGASGAHVLYQAGQHASVIGAIAMLEAEGASVESFEIADLKSKLRNETVLVTMDAVNSETGERFDTLGARRTLDAYRPGMLLHVDAAQALRTQSFTLSHLGADMVSLDAQKVGGVRGIGALLMRQGISLTPLIQGGGQERGRRPGTESPALAASFATALGEVEEERKNFTERAELMRAALLQKISSVRYMVLNEGKENAPHIVNISMVGRDTDYLVALLDKRGFAVSTKSACESDSTEGSRAVLALTNDRERAAATLRISWGPTTRSRDIDAFAHALIRAVRFLDDNAI